MSADAGTVGQVYQMALDAEAEADDNTRKGATVAERQAAQVASVRGGAFEDVLTLITDTPKSVWEMRIQYGLRFKDSWLESDKR